MREPRLPPERFRVHRCTTGAADHRENVKDGSLHNQPAGIRTRTFGAPFSSWVCSTMHCGGEPMLHIMRDQELFDPTFRQLKGNATITLLEKNSEREAVASNKASMKKPLSTLISNPRLATVDVARSPELHSNVEGLTIQIKTFGSTLGMLDHEIVGPANHHTDKAGLCAIFKLRSHARAKEATAQCDNRGDTLQSKVGGDHRNDRDSAEWGWISSGVLG